MKLLEKILVPVKFETNNDKIIFVASDFAKRYNSEIVLLNVLPNEARTTSLKHLVEKGAADSLQEMHSKVLEHQHANIKQIIEYGSPFDKIISVAEKEQVNLILMGSGQDTENLKYPLDVTTQKVMRKVDKPVWVVKHDQEKLFERILCPVDFSEHSTIALKNALQLAHKFKVQINVISVFEPINIKTPAIKAELTKENISKKEAYEKEFEHFLTKFNLNDIDITTEILEGVPSEVILNYIKEHKMSLLVMGTSGKSSLSRILMGSVTEKVTREVPSSFITIKSEDIIHLKLENAIHNVESHFSEAEKLMENRLYNEAKKQYKACLKLNGLHIPSYFGIAKAYDKLGEKVKAEQHHLTGKRMWQKIYNEKIEREIKMSIKY